MVDFEYGNIICHYTITIPDMTFRLMRQLELAVFADRTKRRGKNWKFASTIIIHLPGYNHKRK